MKRMVLGLTVISAVLLSCVILGGVRFAAWALELPNRVVVDGDAIAETMRATMIQSYHEGLSSDQEDVKLEILRSFTDAAGDDPQVAEWIRQEFTVDLQTLVESGEPDVSLSAQKLLSNLSSSAIP